MEMKGPRKGIFHMKMVVSEAASRADFATTCKRGGPNLL
jgi:hypothetical protein